METKQERGAITLLALQDLIFEESGKVEGVRVLLDARIELSFQRSGELWGVAVTTLLTAVGTRQPDGAVVFEGMGIATTADGDSVTIKTWGVRRPTGAGLKSRSQGGEIWQTASQKFARLNSTTYAREAEADEVGNYHLKLWEWKEEETIQDRGKPSSHFAPRNGTVSMYNVELDRQPQPS